MSLCGTYVLLYCAMCNLHNHNNKISTHNTALVDTPIFVKMVTRMWNMINIKSPHAGTNDPDRNPFCDKSDERLVYIYVKLQQRLRGWITLPKVAECIVQKFSGLVALIKYKLDVGFKYVLPGKDQSDRIEAEFGIYRQNSGGNYCISTYQVYNGLKLQRIKLYHQLEMSEKLHISVSDQCCENVKENIEDLDILGSSFQISLQLSSLEKSTLYYISGCVAFKEGCSVDIQGIQGDDSVFVNKVSLGRLGRPPSDLYDLSQYLFAFFKTREKKCCSKLFLDAYQMIYDKTNIEFDNISSILSRFNNC